eukprot:gene18129-biopygen21919
MSRVDPIHSPRYFGNAPSTGEGVGRQRGEIDNAAPSRAHFRAHTLVRCGVWTQHVQHGRCTRCGWAATEVRGGGVNRADVGV